MTPTTDLSVSERNAILLGLLGLIGSFGIARFIYTPLLPLMQTELHFGEHWAGILAAFNYVGYLVGALGASFIHELRDKQRLFKIAIVLATVSNIGMGVIAEPNLWLGLRFGSGLASAGVMILGSSLMMLSIQPRYSGRALAIYFAGVGIGICLGAFWVLLLKDVQDWRGLWVSSGLLIFVLGLPALLHNPWQLHPAKKASHSQVMLPKRIAWVMAFLAAAYFCEGIGYVISATFLVSILQKSAALPQIGDYAWVVVGLAAAPSCWLWMRIAERWGEFPALISAYLVQAVGIIFPILSQSTAAAFIGAILFGGTFMGIVSLVLIYGGRLGGSRPARLMGLLTACFGVAQIIGPALAGWLAEQQGSFATSLLLAAGISVLGAALIVVTWRLARA